MSNTNLSTPEIFRRLALSVGNYCHPNYDATALLHDGDDLIVVGTNDNERPAIRITSDGKFTTTFPGPHNNGRWISIIGYKMNIDDILVRRSVSLGAHSAIRYKDTSEALSTDAPGEMTGELLGPSHDSYLHWYSVRLKLVTFPQPTPKTYDRSATREASRKIREQWKVHMITKRVLGDNKALSWSARKQDLRIDRTKRANALINLSYEDFAIIASLYSTVDTAIASCNTEIYDLVGA